MHMSRLLVALLVTASITVAAQAPRPVLYEGARLITGDGSAPIERSAFLVENGRFTRVGRQGEMQAPAGAARVDLTRQDRHPGAGRRPLAHRLHEGPDQRRRRTTRARTSSTTCTGSPTSASPPARRWAATSARCRFSCATRFSPASIPTRRGSSPPAAAWRRSTRSARTTCATPPIPVTTAQGARAVVQELAPRKVTLIKTWVDDRGGAVKKLTPELYGAIIDEAHKHNMRVAVHATGLDDAKDLLRAGIDVFAHMISDVDDELVALFKQHPKRRVLSGARRAAPGGLCAVAQPGAPADRRNGVARADRAAAGPARRTDARRSSARSQRPGIGWRAASAARGRRRQDRRRHRRRRPDRAISSSAGRCTPSSRTWWRRA